MARNIICKKNITFFEEDSHVLDYIEEMATKTRNSFQSVVVNMLEELMELKQQQSVGVNQIQPQPVVEQQQTSTNTLVNEQPLQPMATTISSPLGGQSFNDNSSSVNRLLSIANKQ